MTLAALGAFLLIALVILVLRGQISWVSVLVAVLFGVVISHVGFGQVAHDTAGGIHTAFSALADALSGKGKS